MTRRTFRWSTLVAVLAIGAGCGGADTADDMEADGEAGMADTEGLEPGEDDGIGEFEITMAGDMTGVVRGTEVQCAEFGGTRHVTATGEHNGESLDVALSNEVFDDGTVGKAIFGSYLRSAGQGGTLTIDDEGATFEGLEVETVTITGSITC